MDRPADDLERELQDTGWLRRLARSVVRDDATADDVVQETALAALRSGPSRTGAVRAWLTAVARNAARRMRRDAGRREARENAVARPEASSDADETSDRLEAARALLAAVEALEEPYRTAIRLRWLDGLPPREVAARTGVTPEVAWKRLSRGLAMLRTRLDRDHGGRRAWLFLVADLGGVRTEELPLRPLAAGAAAAVLSWKLAAAVLLVAAGTAAVVTAMDAAQLVPPEVDQRTADAGDGRSSTAADSASAPHGERRAARPRARAEPNESPETEPAAPAVADRSEPPATPPDPPKDRVVGRALDPDGHPVAGASVSLRLNGARRTGTVRTADDGTFVLSQPADHSHPNELMVESDAWATTFAPLPEFGPGEIPAGDVALAAPRPIAGIVTTREGTPLAGARIFLGSPVSGGQVGAPAVTGDDGRFRFDAAGPGSWSVSLSPPAGQETRWICRRTQLSIPGGDTDVRFVVHVREPGTARVALDVVDGAGAPVDIAAGMMRRPRRTWVCALSAASFDEGRDASGPISLRGADDARRSVALEDLRPGDWWVLVKTGDLGPVLAPLHVDPGDTSLCARVLLPRPGAVLVALDFGGTAPPPDAVVAVGGVPGSPWGARPWSADFSLGGWAKRSADGLWSLDGVGPGRYRLTLFARNWRADEVTVDVPAGGVVEASLVAQPGGKVEWAPVVPIDHEAEIAFASGDDVFRVGTEFLGCGEPQPLALPSFPPGRLRWRVRIAPSGVLASEGRRIATYTGAVNVVAGRTVRLPDGPFDGPR